MAPLTTAQGLEAARYRVQKTNDPTGKHDDCRYFVLDPEHDPAALLALQLYAAAVANDNPALARDLLDWIG